MIREFNILRKIGEGSFGVVYLVKRNTDGNMYALKRVKLHGLSEKEKQNALNEIRLLASVQHENVIEYKESFIDVNTQTLCLVMEFAAQGDVLSKIDNHFKKGTCFAEFELWSFLIQCLGGLKALHDLQIMHRDLKSANILVGANGACKLADFNVSKVVTSPNGLLRTQTGTPYYASPEVWSDKPYSFKSDIWSLGCVMYEMAALRPPFKSSDMKGLFKKVTKAEYPPLPNRYSKEFREIIHLMLQPKPENRPSCDQLLGFQTIQFQADQLCLYDKNIVGAMRQFYQLTQSGSHLNFDQKNPAAEGALINTLKMPRILKQLQQQLPKSNYRSLNINVVEPRNAVSIENNDNKVEKYPFIGITPQQRSSKFEKINFSSHERPMSSRVGNFIDKIPRVGLAQLPEIVISARGPNPQRFSYDADEDVEAMMRFDPPDNIQDFSQGNDHSSYPDFLQNRASIDKENKPVLQHRKLVNNKEASRRNLQPSNSNRKLQNSIEDQVYQIGQRSKAIQAVVDNVQQSILPLQIQSKNNLVTRDSSLQKQQPPKFILPMKKQSIEQKDVFKRNLGEIRQSRLQQA